MAAYLITCYVDPDLDGLACTVAYAEFLRHQGQEVIEGIFGRLSDEARYMVDNFKIEVPKIVGEPKDYKKVIMVDASEPALHRDINLESVVEIIDHRRVHDAHLFPNAKVQIEPLGAAATMITEKFMVTNTEISSISALLLYGAIVSNTLNFQANVTTDRDIKAAEWLKQHTNIPDNLAHDMFLAKSDFAGEKLILHLQRDFAIFDRAGRRTCVYQMEMIGARKLAHERKREIQAEMTQKRVNEKLDMVFLSIIDVEEGINVFICDNREAEDLLTALFNVKFEEGIAVRPGLIMRKEIVPLMIEYFQKQPTV